MILDAETNGLKPSVIWCVVVKHNGEVHEFTDQVAFKAFLVQNPNERVYAHNGLNYDYPVLERLWGVCWDGFDLRDTLVLSRLYNPSLPGGHSLKAWGERLGFPKGDYSDWSCFTPEMLKYCVQDVLVTEKLLEKIGDPEVYASELEFKVAEIMGQQEDDGWLLDQGLCWEVMGGLKERKMALEEEVHRRFKPLATFVREITPRFKQDGTMSVVGLKFLAEPMDVAGVFTRIEYPEFNLGSRQQIGRYLKRFGWEPKTFTETGQAIVDEKVLEGVSVPEAQLIAEYLMVEKRVAMIQSWLDNVGDDGRVHGRVNPIGAVTGRMTHYTPNVAQVTAKGKPYGDIMRQCWHVGPGRKLVGMDASGLELRVLAHYMNDKDYLEEVLNGDIHTANRLAAGLTTRDQAKTFIYAFLYGAGDAKIGSIIGETSEGGKRLKAKFLANTPSLKSLRDRVSTAARRGWLKGLDGRRIVVRSPHAALNTLLQGGGAVVMKEAMVLVHERAKELNVDFMQVGNIHDELQFDTAAKDVILMKEAAEWGMEQAGVKLGLRCPMKGDVNIGDHWGETH